MDLKKPLSYDQQVLKLKEHSIQVDDAEGIRVKLKEIGYYRLSGYALQYRISENDSDCIEGTSTTKILRLYEFDSKLRNLLREYLEIAEVYARSVIAYNFSLRNCAEPPHDQHYNHELFDKEKEYNEVINNFSKKKRYYNDSPIMKHHISNYGGKLPLWAITEMISFSDLSKLFSSMKSKDQDSIAIDFHTGKALLKNNLHCLAVLRNKCSHAARLYNTENNPPVRFNRTILRKFPNLKEGTLFAYIIALILFLPEKNAKVRFKNRVAKLFMDYSDVIEPKYIGLCEDYKEIIRYATKH